VPSQSSCIALATFYFFRTCYSVLVLNCVLVTQTPIVVVVVVVFASLELLQLGRTESFYDYHNFEMELIPH